MVFSSLEQLILKTLCYFDVRGVCLRASELPFDLAHSALSSWPKGQGGGVRPPEVLNNLSKIGVVEEMDGFWFLKGRGELVAKRLVSEKESERKLVIATKAAKLLRFVPFLRAVMVCNSVAEGTATSESDIDLLVVADVKRIWIARFFANLILKVFRLRTGKGHNKNKICLSYFIDANNLNFSNIRIAKDDIHKAFWISQLMAIYDIGNFGERIIMANGWIKDLIPNLLHARGVDEKFVVKDSRVAKLWRGFWERAWRGKYGNVVESEAKKFQMTLLRKRLGGKINAPGFGVVINDGMIKLHENDTRAEVRRKWFEKIKIFNF